MHIFHQNIIGNLQIHMTEVPDTFHTPFCQIMSNFHSLRTRQCQNGNVHVVVFHIFLHFVHIVNFHAADGHANQTGIDIKNCFDDKTAFFKIGIIDQRLTDVAAADDDHVVHAIQSQYLFDFIVKIFYIIAISLLTKAAEIVQILTNLRGCNIHLCTEFFGRNSGDVAFQQIAQIPIISG